MLFDGFVSIYIYVMQAMHIINILISFMSILPFVLWPSLSLKLSRFILPILIC